MRRSASLVCSVSATLALLSVLAATTLAANASVTIENSQFTPRTVSVLVGERVTWTNRDPFLHTATGENRAFDAGALQPGQTRSVTFTSSGTFPYFCQIHTGMRGMVTVQSLATPVPTARPTTPPASIVPTATPSPAPTAAPSPTARPSPVPTATPVATLAIASPTRSAAPVAISSPSVSPEPGPGPAIVAGAAIAIAGLGLTAFVLWRRRA